MSGAGRFAPSPTSDLHLGNLRTALLAWLYARQQGHLFIVRNEDLDTQRVNAAPMVAQRQLDDLSVLGLDWDGPVIRQSERLDMYHEALKSLDVYECFCTRREIAEASGAPHSTYRPYPGTCLKLSEQAKVIRRRERPAALRVRAEGAHCVVNDLHAGAVEGIVDDFVLFRNDGTPAYNLAVVVDDGLQRIVQVCRGRDLLDSSPRQTWLATRLGFSPSEYIHVGLAVNAQGKRLAKRDGAVTMAALAKLGSNVGAIRDQIAVSCGLPTGLTPTDMLELPELPSLLANPALAEDWVVNCAQAG